MQQGASGQLQKRSQQAIQFAHQHVQLDCRQYQHRHQRVLAALQQDQVEHKQHRREPNQQLQAEGESTARGNRYNYKWKNAVRFIFALETESQYGFRNDWET